MQDIPMFKVPTYVISRLLNRDETYVRYALQKEVLPIGFALKRKRWAYTIIPKKVCEYTGISMETLKKMCDEYYTKREKYSADYKRRTQVRTCD